MPNRIIKESICTSDTIAKLSDFQENFFYRLIVNCDDYGRMDARPPILKARLYPLRERLTFKDIQSALRALVDVGCVEVYEVDGKPYLRLPSWEVHQQIRAKKSKFPSPDITRNQMKSDDSKCPRNPIQSESNPESEDDRAGAREPSVGPSSSVGSAMAFFLDRVNPMPSERDRAELADFEADLGAAVCIRAMMIALEQQKAKWSFIRGILRNKQAAGIRSMEAWDAHEAEREQRKEGQRGRASNDGGSSVAEEYGIKPDVAL